ncbi:hypothetical protein JCM10212_007028 [Sporobolomyces blumeae]
MGADRSDKPRKSSTKGRHIVQVNPLAKGQSCITCRVRKVRCSADRPACAACLRTAKFEGRDLATVKCEYDQGRREGGARKKKDAASNKGLLGSEAQPEVNDNNDARQQPQQVRGSMADLLNGQQGGEAASNSIYPLPLPPASSFRLVEPQRSNSWDSVHSNGAAAAPAATSTNAPHLSYAQSYAATPPLSFSTGSSPNEPLVPSPPASEAGSTSGSPALDAWGNSVSQRQVASTSTAQPYPYTLPPMYPASNLLTSMPLQTYSPTPVPAADPTSYSFDPYRRPPPTDYAAQFQPSSAPQSTSPAPFATHSGYPGASSVPAPARPPPSQNPSPLPTAPASATTAHKALAFNYTLPLPPTLSSDLTPNPYARPNTQSPFLRHAASPHPPPPAFPTYQAPSLSGFPLPLPLHLSAPHQHHATGPTTAIAPSGQSHPSASTTTLPGGAPPGDPTFCLPLGSASNTLYSKESTGASGPGTPHAAFPPVSTPGFADVDSWLRGLAN